jgi:hypothetical protein
MKKTTFIYGVPEIPDPYCSKYQAISGDVRSAVGRDFEHLLRILASFSPDAASVAIRFVFTPKPANGNLQSRLRIFVIAHVHDSGIAESLKLLLERGHLTRFYQLNRIDNLESPWEKLQAGCEIVRREEAINPLHPPEFNDRVPFRYYSIQSFEPDNRNDYLALDRVLSNIPEPVVVDIQVQPTDVSAEMSNHAEYLSRLHSINRVWDDEEDGGRAFRDDFDDKPGWGPARDDSIKPLRYRDPQADEILRSQQRFHETLRRPHLLFHIIALAGTPAVSQLVASFLAESAFEAGSYRLRSFARGAPEFKEALLRVKSASLNPANPHWSFFDDAKSYSGFSRLSRVASVDELAGVFRMPMASLVSPNCIRKNTDPNIENGGPNIIHGYDQETTGMPRGISKRKMCSHLFVCGATGFGKSTAIISLILQIHKHRIPFVVIEPVKTEYRNLKTLRNDPDKDVQQLAEELEIYTPGDESVSPFRLNPLEIRPGLSIDEHAGNLLSCFMAAMPVSGPLPALLGEALERVYEDFPDMNNPPTINDLIATSQRVLEEKGYSSETRSDIMTALEVRLGIFTRLSPGKVFQCKNSVPGIDHLMKVPAIIEFDKFPQKQVCLPILFLLTSFREYFKTVPQKRHKNNPRYVIIIEEAHNIVGSNSHSSPSPDVADPASAASEYVCRMLSELRALGVMIVIVDQFPALIAAEVIKSTVSKLAFNQVAKDDREELAAAMLLGHTGAEDLARLKTGEAFFFTEGYDRSRRLSTINVHDQFDLSMPPPNNRILPYIEHDDWFVQATSERTLCELTQIREEMDRFDEVRLKYMNEFARLLALRPQILSQQEPVVKSTKLQGLREDCHRVKQSIASAYRSFLRNSYKRYLSSIEYGGKDPLIQEMRNDLVNRFESIIEPDIKKSLDMIDRSISSCLEDER